MKYLSLAYYDEKKSDVSTTTVRPRNGNVSIPDGPFAKTKEQVGVAAALNEHLGWGIEVRPTEMFERP